MANKYPPIEADRKEFRLLNIRPRFPSILNIASPPLEFTIIQCDLFVASRDNPPDYQTLSYAWGNPIGTVPILVNGGLRQRYQEDRSRDGFILVRILSTVFVEGFAKATNKKDYIFALLGIASDKGELGLKPNYDESISDIIVYTDAARAIILAGHVYLLSISQHEPNSNDSQEKTYLLSWVLGKPNRNTRWTDFIEDILRRFREQTF